MSSTTAKYAIPYSTGGDLASTIDDTMQALANKVDLLMGEYNDTTITPSAVDTTTSVRVNYSRSYATVAVPKVIAVCNEARATAAVVNVWTSAEDATGFTLNIRSSTTAARLVRWFARP